MNEVVVNSIIEWITEEGTPFVERILWVNPEYTLAVAIPLNQTNALPEYREIEAIEKALHRGGAIKRVIEPMILATIEEDIKPIHRQKRDKAWDIIKELVAAEPEIYDPKKRGPLIELTCQQFQICKRDVYTSLRRYWQNGKVKNGLLPHYYNCGAPGITRKTAVEGKKRGRPPKITKVEHEKVGININEDIKRIFRVAYQLYYDSKKKRPFTHAYEMMIQKHFSKGKRVEDGIEFSVLPPTSELPTIGQFRYWISKENDLKKSIIARFGENRFNLSHRAVLGSSSKMAEDGPGSMYQIDATLADVYLVNRYKGLPIIGRPVIYTVMDVFSRMITGIYVGLEGPSWIGAMMALANAASDKVSFCAEYGINITKEEWPCNYLPRRILADRGEMLSKHADHLSNSLDITITNTPPYRADWKGIVEQHFRLANLRTIHWLPGAVKQRFRERGEPDYRLDATLDLYQFTKIMINTILYHNNQHFIEWYQRDELMVEDEVKRIPLHLWNWGIKRRSGHLREKPEKIVKLNLMPCDKAVVTYQGIRYKGMYFGCDRAIREQWFERARAKGNWTIPISYDPRKADVIYYRSGDENLIEPCELLEREERYRGKRIEEVEDLIELEKIECISYQSVELQSKADYRTRNETIIQEADKMKEAFEVEGISRSKRVKDIRKNKALTKEENRQSEAWDLRDLKPEEPKESLVHKESDTQQIENIISASKTKKKTILDMLQKQKIEGE